MLLDSTTSLKIARDIIYDSFGFLGVDPRGMHKTQMPKWTQLLASPDDPGLPSDSTVPAGYVEFTYADGHAIQIPCVWRILLLSDGTTRSSITLRNNTATATWEYKTVDSAYGALKAVFLERLSEIGVLRVNGLIAHNSAEYGHILTLMVAAIHNLTANDLDAAGASIESLRVTGKTSLEECSFTTLDAPNCEADIQDGQISSATVSSLTFSSGTFQFIEKFNASPENGTTSAMDVAYTKYIPFNALSDDGMPINGYANPIATNPFYPDFIYAYANSAIWNASILWAPSISRPTSPYWQDSDGIYWYKARVFVDYPYGGFGNVALSWPPCSSTAEQFDCILPPMKADADGMIVTVQSGPIKVLVATTNRYTRDANGNWSWLPGETATLAANHRCQFIAKRNFIMSGDEISAVEYQFLPIGCLHD